MVGGQRIGGVEIEIAADLAGFNRSQAQAKRTAENTADQIAISYVRGGQRITRSFESSAARIRREQQSIANSFLNTQQRIRQSSNQMANDLRAAIAGIGIAAALRQTVAYGDQWTIAENKIAAAGIAHEDLGEHMSKVVGLARETGVEFAAIATLYGRATLSSQQLGLSQEEVYKVTERTAKAFVAGGASAAEQAAGITQLTQALQSSVLQGDELRSLRENAPLLTQAIAEEFGVTIGQLKKLGEEGKLTSDRVARAIIKADGVQTAFARTNRTVAQSINNLETAFIEYIGTSETLGGAMENLAGFIRFVTDNIELFADAAIVAASVLGGTLAAGAIISLVRSLGTMVASVRAAKTAFDALKISAAFFTGPVGAVILAIGTALGFMAVEALSAGDAVENLTKSIDDFTATQRKLSTDTERLREAQDTLNKAIETQGRTAQNAARLHVQAIEDQIAAGKRLLDQQRLKINMDLQTLRQQNQPIDGMGKVMNNAMAPLLGFFPDLENKTIGDTRKYLFEDITSLLGRRSGPGTDTARLDEARNYLNSLRRPFTDLEQKVSAALTIIDQYDRSVADLEQRITELDAMISPEQEAARAQMGRDFGGLRGDRAGLPDSEAIGASSRALKGYKEEAEKLRDTLRQIGEAAAADEAIINRAFMSFDVINDLRTRYQQWGAYAGNVNDLRPGQPQEYDPISLEELRAISEYTEAQDSERLAKIQNDIGANAAERSRAALQAMLDFADGAGVKAALEQLPNVSELMLGDDVETFRSKMRERVAATSDEMAVGYEKLARDRDARVKEIKEAMDAELAVAGYGDMDFSALDASERRSLPAEVKNIVGFYLNLVTEAVTSFNDDVAALAKRTGPDINLDTPELDALGERLGDTAVADMLAANQRALEASGVWPTEAQLEFERQMTASIRNALYQGIVSGDWGDAFMMVVADALSTALADSLTGVGAWLGEFLFGQGGVLSSALSLAVTGIGSLFGMPVTPMANGGNFQAGKPLLVGEAGREVLLPNFSGTVVPNSALTGSQGAYAGADPTVIGGIRMGDIHVHGDVGTADTLRQIRAEQEAQARRLPKVVAATMREVKRRQ